MGDGLADMRREARREYERKYTAARGYGLMLEIYEEAIARTSASRRTSAVLN